MFGSVFFWLLKEFLLYDSLMMTKAHGLKATLDTFNDSDFKKEDDVRR